LIPRSHDWLDRTDAHWDGGKRQWRFPSGAILDFGYLDHDDNLRNYQSAAYQFIGFDELTHFMEKWYRYMFSRTRRLMTQMDIPVRVRGASNPGGVGHEWVKQRFLVEGAAKGRIFIPAKLEDNPYLDTEEYDKSLEELDPVTRAQLRDGDWDTKEPGEFFSRNWFRVIDEEDAPPGVRWIRSWDLAATKSKTAAYTAGVRMASLEGKVYIDHVARQRGDPGETEQLVRHTAEADGKAVSIWIEQEGGSGGVNTIWRYQRTVLFGYSVQPFHPRMDKLTRARPLSAVARYGGIFLVRRKGLDNSWISTFLDEANSFPNSYKDQIDSATQGFTALTTASEPRIRSL
jgi:predicted phage terminase large subunit-like protein